MHAYAESDCEEMNSCEMVKWQNSKGELRTSWNRANFEMKRLKINIIYIKNRVKENVQL